ncbi:hypothetical protein HPB50_003381 [Hyalomma asiaticum]|uniref:Uncharacterized protein n=1 Tax=Hyalomma asiaticum TaxID=266040 RepID=A0ACB7TGJ4_HYAAI|nr:hypothetical protein HPB50_003381 [Hyalomma asiaticum]
MCILLRRIYEATLARKLLRSPLTSRDALKGGEFVTLHASRENGGSFNGRQPVKKKRKSRTAFTNHQIFELEKRFLYQKYLSPADRDEIAQSLGLTNAQVITWFQNRRAKLKRDMEELKKDMDAAKIHTIHKTLLDNIQDLSSFKKDIHKAASGP